MNIKKIKYNNVKLDNIKEAFIKDCDGKGYEIKDIINLMKKTQYAEGAFSKSFQNFSKADLLSMLTAFCSRSKITMMTYRNIYQNYFDFVIKHKIRYTDDNPASMISDYDLEELYDDTTNLRYITRNELYDEVLPLIEYKQQKLATALTFEGIRGKACEEAISLKEENFDIENKTITYEKEYKGKKYIQTVKIDDDRFWDIYKEVIYHNEDTTYMVQNGKYDIKLEIDTDYIFKPTVKQCNTDAKRGINPERKIRSIIYEKMIRESFANPKLWKNYVTGNTLYASGVMDAIYRAELKAGEELRYTDIKDIIEKKLLASVSPMNIQEVYHKFKPKLESEFEEEFEDEE